MEKSDHKKTEVPASRALTSKGDKPAEMSELMKSHLDAVSGGAGHQSWRSRA